MNKEEVRNNIEEVRSKIGFFNKYIGELKGNQQKKGKVEEWRDKLEDHEYGFLVPKESMSEVLDYMMKIQVIFVDVFEKHIEQGILIPFENYLDGVQVPKESKKESKESKEEEKIDEVSESRKNKLLQTTDYYFQKYFEDLQSGKNENQATVWKSQAIRKGKGFLENKFIKDRWWELQKKLFDIKNQEPEDSGEEMGVINNDTAEPSSDNQNR